MTDFTLRPYREADVASLAKYADNYNVARFLRNAFPHPYTEKDGQQFIASIIGDSPTKVFAIDMEGEAVGAIGLFPQTDVSEKSAELGYWLGEPFWGRGIVTRAIGQMVEYGLRTWDITRIFATPFSINVASQRVLEKAGFTLEARLRDAFYKNGEYMDELIYTKHLNNLL
ncbi:MAG: GNAT family N-acetyltransferase [Rikenellaceae bacterium]|nr:GNAT family N-acetyltransferase [Rikenellaceae bacterium]MCL2692632.1 GNAT family N-acetyltransferase [Rikenellaceae bacterium]